MYTISIIMSESNIYNTIPPMPHVVEAPAKQEFIPGQFLYIKDKSSREMVKNGWLAVTQLELWGYMKKKCESYMICNDPEIWRITDKMAELGYNYHSGCSFGWTMRQLQEIAQHGEQRYAIERWSSQIK